MASPKWISVVQDWSQNIAKENYKQSVFLHKKATSIFFTVTSRSLDKYPTSPLIFITLRHEKYEGPSPPA